VILSAMVVNCDCEGGCVQCAASRFKECYYRHIRLSSESIKRETVRRSEPRTERALSESEGKSESRSSHSTLSQRLTSNLRLFCARTRI